MELDLKNIGLPYWAWILDLDSKNNWTTLLNSGWFYDILDLDLKSTYTTFLDLDWFYDILDLDLRSTWTNVLDSDWFYYNQEGMLLEKSGSLLEISVKELVIQSRLASSISLGLISLVREKPNVNVVCSRVRYFLF